MQITRCGNTEDTLTKSLKKYAAKQALAKIAVKEGVSWEDAREEVLTSMTKASELGPIEEHDILETLERLATNGVKIGDGSPEAILKEAQWLGKGLQWLGRGLGGAGKAVGKGWEMAKGVGQAIQQLPETMQAKGREMEQQAHVNNAKNLAQQWRKLHQSLTQTMKALNFQGNVGDFVRAAETGKLGVAAPVAPAPAGQAAGAPAMGVQPKPDQPLVPKPRSTKQAPHPYDIRRDVYSK